MKAAIVGASGYSGRELVSLLVNHPLVTLDLVTSRSLEGQTVESHIPRLRGKCSQLKFANPSIEELANSSDCDLFFLALPHGTASSYALPLLENGKKVIDLSADFRLNSASLYEEFYDSPHPSPQWLEKAIYGLPEIHSISWDQSNLIASPGCYPTSLIIPLFPLLQNRLINQDGIVANSMSGISGAGRNASERLLFCERNESACAYGLPKHRHLSEIEEQLSIANKEQVTLSFHPHLAPMNRGICSTISVLSNGSLDRDSIVDCWTEFYKNRKFVHILNNGEFPDVKDVVGTNRIDLAVNLDERTNRYVICSAEDNLLKGAGGQAVQAMNICLGFDEGEGLP